MTRTVPSSPTAPYQPGQRVRVTQQVPRAIDSLSTVVEGVVVAFEQQKTGSWYAHTRDNKVWIDRLQLRKDDGEIVFLNLDQYSHVEIVSAPRASPAL